MMMAMMMMTVQVTAVDVSEVSEGSCLNWLNVSFTAVGGFSPCISNALFA